MGNCFSDKPDEPIIEPVNSKKKKSEELVRFFMVGMGSAGKSTVIKQLQKLCHDRPETYTMYDEEWKPINHQFQTYELEKWKKIIQKNILDAVCLIEQNAHDWGLRRSSPLPASGRLLHLVGDLTTLSGREIVIDDDVIASLLTTIDDAVFQQALHRIGEIKGELQVADGTVFFLNSAKARQVFSPSYVPTDEDIVHGRAPTTGIQDYRFGIKNMRIQIHDIGGQRVERGNLLKYITNWVSSDRTGYKNFILYVVNIAEYHIPHPVHTDITLLDESMAMLQNVVELQPVQNCGLMIFFNKEDVFKNRIENCRTQTDIRDATIQRLGNYMRDGDKRNLAKGEAVNPENMKKAVAAKFSEAIKNCEVKRKKGVHSKFTCAVDTKMMGSLFTAIDNEIINFKIETGAFIFP